MKWVLGGCVLAAFGAILRRILQLDGNRSPGLALRPMGSLREAVFESIALELETHTAMLGVALNDAIEECEDGRLDIAWKLVRLAAEGWLRLAEIVTVTLNTVNDYMPVARVVVPARQMGKQRYLSPVMFDYARTNDFLQQFMFRSKMRFQMHLRVLRKAVELLTADFTQVYRSAGQAKHYPPELWRAIDLRFHDFDLLTKESLLALRSFLMGLPDSELGPFSAALQAALPRGASHAAAVPVER